MWFVFERKKSNVESDAIHFQRFSIDCHVNRPKNREKMMENKDRTKTID